MKLEKNGAGTMTTAKNPVFIGLYLENCCFCVCVCGGGGDQLLVGEIKFDGGSLLRVMRRFLTGREGLHPPFPPVGKTLNRGGWGYGG